MKPLSVKRKYEKPVMKVFELKGRQQLLVGSGEWPTGINPMDDPEDI